MRALVNTLQFFRRIKVEDKFKVATSPIFYLAEKADGYVDSSGSISDIHYDYRAIIAFCRKQGIEPADMTIRELQQFIIA